MQTLTNEDLLVRLDKPFPRKILKHARKFPRLYEYYERDIKLLYTIMNNIWNLGVSSYLTMPTSATVTPVAPVVPPVEIRSDMPHRSFKLEILILMGLPHWVGY